MNTVEKIKNQIDKYPVLLYMKGSPQFPMCGFSSRVINILRESNVSYAFVNVLDNPDIRQELPKYANWPTFPQLYVNQELIGGCDIIVDLQNSGELKTVLTQSGAIAENKDNLAIVAAEV